MVAAGKDSPIDIQSLRLADDIFMRACFQKNKDCAALMLRIILGKPNLEVERVETQKALDKIGGRSLRLDVLATDSEARQVSRRKHQPTTGSRGTRETRRADSIDGCNTV